MKIRKWNLLLVCLLVSLFVFSCGSDDDDDDSLNDNDDDAADDDDDAVQDDDAADDDAADDDAADDDDDDWQPVEPHTETYEHFTIAWYAGTPYEMGFQQGELLHEELKAGIDWLQTYHLVDILVPVARILGLLDLAEENSYPEIIEECQGMADAAGDVGWSMEVCMLLNFGDILVEFLSHGFPPAKASLPGCSQAVAMGDATVDGRLYHARSLDWDKIDFLLDYPVIHVRQPEGGVPHVYIGFPGNLSPYNGLNAAGISIASDEADPLDAGQHDRTGRSHVQMQAHILATATNLDEAIQIVQETDHMTVEGIMVADGPNGRAAAFEMTSTAVGIRELTDDVVLLTNHFVAPETKDLDGDPVSDSSRRRYERLQQLIEPDGQDTIYGEIEPSNLVGVLRDRINPDDGTESPLDAFDNNSSIATNGAIYQVVFDPERLLFWVAAGDIPVPSQPFVGFSLGELLDLPDAVPVEPAVFE